MKWGARMFYRMDRLELACGWVAGYDEDPLPPDPGVTPREALDATLRDCLSRQPCMIAFSGGRDSSVLLAVAVRVARREDLPMPIPLTLRYRDAIHSNESQWQQLVLDHLAVPDHHVLTVGNEHDPIGPIAAPLLRRHGLVWPPNFAPTWRLLDVARGGVLVTGEAGDEVLGSTRITPVTYLLRSLKARRRPSRRLCRAALRALAPVPVRRRLELRDGYLPPWLRDPVGSLCAQRVVADELACSLHAGRQTWQLTTRRAVRRMLDSFSAFAAENGTEYRAPFSEPDFVSALAHTIGPLGWGDRTDTMTRLFSDVLPAAILSRTSKALFNHAVFTEHTRAFARQWDGTGVDHTLVDPDALHQNWLSETPHAPAMGLLQSAWLASQPTASGRPAWRLA